MPAMNLPTTPSTPYRISILDSIPYQVLPLNADERLIGIQPHQSILIISNIMFARFLVMSIVLEPWAHNIVPANAQSKQSAANFKHISSLLLHVYNLAVVSLTGIPLAQLRGVTSADGLLQSTDEGFQVMLRHCEDEWLQQLKSSIESWLKFIVQSVSPVLLGMSGEALPQQALANQPAPAEIMAIPEVRSMVHLDYDLLPKTSLYFTFCWINFILRMLQSICPQIRDTLCNRRRPPALLLLLCLHAPPATVRSSSRR